MTRRSFFALVLTAFLCLSALHETNAAGAATRPMASFQASVGEESRTATVELIDQDGAPYVSLTSLVRQLKGECSLFAARGQVDLGGQTAWVHVNGVGVNSSLGAFSIRKPVLREGDSLLMAMADIEAFFERAFRITVRQARATSAGRADAREGRRERVRSDDLPGFDEPDALGPFPTIKPPKEVSALAQSGVIVVDPGHGGSDQGAEGRGGLTEKELTLAVALKLQQALQKMLNVNVLLTRGKDVLLPAEARSHFANYHDAALLVSIHAGASYATVAHGFELFIPTDDVALTGALSGTPSMFTDPAPVQARVRQSREVATAIAGGLSQATDAAERGVRQSRCRVFEGLNMPGVLVEVGCLTNGAEEALLETEAYQDLVAQGIAEGIQRIITGSPREEPVP